jgi:hypothetical protein
MRDRSLFSEADLAGVLAKKLAEAHGKVDSIPQAQFENSSDAEILEHLVSHLTVEPLILALDNKVMEHGETRVDVSRDPMRFHVSHGQLLVPGILVRVTVPFSGESFLWRYRPSTYTTCFPRGVVTESGGGVLGGEVAIEVAKPTDALGDGAALKREVDSALTSFQKWVGFVGQDVGKFNQNLRTTLQKAIADRRARLKAHDTVLQAIDIPLKRREGVPDVSTLPLRRRIIRPLPSTPQAPAGFGIREEDYEHILNVVRHELRTFETMPATFAIHDEEGLRDIILAHLNGHYEGQASGETFRKRGKTDIRIEFENRAAFVAECKVWKGEKEIDKAIVQLLDYLTWRDCKGALVIFNKKVAGFSAIQQSLPRHLKEHPQYLGEDASGHAGEWRFRFRSSEDPERVVKLHIFLANLFVREAK